MADRTIRELHEFFNSQLFMPPKKRDWTLTEGEMITMAAYMRGILKIAYHDDEKVKQIHNWLHLFITHCPGFEEAVQKNINEIATASEEMIRIAKEKQDKNDF